MPKDFHILDPACGSGSFLLGAYQYLLDHCLEWYVAHSPEKRKKEVYRVAARSTGVSGTGVSPVFNSGFKHGQACPERSRRDGRATQGNPPLRIRHGAYLPHWTREGATYFVTFRLADSLPQAVVDKWLEERQAVARKAEQANRPLTPAEQQRLQRLFCEKVDAYLDAAHGSCLLRDERAAKHVEDALLHFDGERYDLLAWSIMPNHVHLVCTPRPGHELPVILHAWKSFTAKQANRLLKRQGAFWQPEYYDHLIRDEKDLQRCMAYTYQNPDKAGLKNWDWRGIGISGTGISGTGASGTSGTGVPPVFNSGFKHGQDGRATSLASSFEWRLTTAERKRILTDHIYGVDIDRQAVEVTKLSLLLKVLEGESADTLGRQLQLFHERALPNLSNNIKCGNSLIGPDYFEGRLPGSIDPDELRRVNPFDWEAAFPHVLGNNVPKTRRGFDAVIGNPPYVKEYTNRQPFRDLLGTQLERYYQGKMDLWYIFASRAIDLLTPSGLHSFIATNNWPTSAGASKLRAKLVSETALTRFVDFGDYKVFSNAGIQTAVYVVAKVAPRAAYQQCRYSRLDNPRASEEPVRVALKHDIFDPPIGHTFDASVEVHEAGTPFTFVNAGTRRVIARMEGVPVFRLGVKDVAQGIVLPQEIVNERQLPRLRQCRARLGDGIFLLSTAEVKRIARTKAERQLIKPYFTTRQISRYFADSRTSVWMLYTTRELELAPNCRSVKRHLDRFQPVITSSNKPYGIHRPRDPYFHVGEKILALRKTSKPDFAYVTFPSYVTQTFNIIKPRSRSYDLRYLTGILNSKLAYFWFWHKGKRQGELLQIDKEPLMRFPLRTVDLRRDEDKAAHDRMVELVDRMLALHKQLHAAEGGTGIPARGQKKHGQDGRATSGTGVPPVFNSGFKHGQDGRATTSWDKELLQRQIDATDRQIDQLVYELYGLTDKEIRIIEQGMRP